MGKFSEWVLGASTWQKVLSSIMCYITGLPWLTIGISICIFRENAPFLNLEPLELDSYEALGDVVPYLITGSVFILTGCILLAFATYYTYRVMYQIQNKSAHINAPLIKNKKAFLKNQPYFCANCENFTDTLREYCEICGNKDSLRKASKKDFTQYIKKKENKNN